MEFVERINKAVFKSKFLTNLLEKHFKIPNVNGITDEEVDELAI